MGGFIQCRDYESFCQKETRTGKVADYCTLFKKFFIGRFFPSIFPRCFKRKEDTQ
jgi:hypothetical protein